VSHSLFVAYISHYYKSATPGRIFLSQKRFYAMPAKQARYYILTIKKASGWRPSADVIRDDLVYAKGQEEVGSGGYEHYQVVVAYSKKVTLSLAKTYFPPCTHLEPTKYQASEDYVWKEETRVAGTQFEFG
jgi:hypothetical protein